MKTIKVLVTEDALDIAQCVIRYLNLQGIPSDNIVHHATLPDAIGYIMDPATTQIDLLVTDWNIPHGNEGGMIINSTRDKFPQVQVIVMTGNPDNLPSISQNYCPDELLPKPFVREELTAAVSNCYKKIEALRAA
jgi:DNA-binding response OmpR family regulator